ncbi:MAG: alkyl hydroperoxide reductase [Chloroflexi bacterium]|nr:alkyl hydroperoxide reductase [Chloroflexota bacterium]
MRRLERKWADVLVVIGVHSAKFPTEQETANVRQAVMRLSLDHPVINDAEFQVWNLYAVRAWPTLFFIDPRGEIIGKHEGEVPFDALDRFVARLVQQYEAEGVLQRGPLPLAPERARLPDTLLRFPGKLVADAASGRLVIADSGHHRVVVAGLDGRLQQVIGRGEPGLADGPLAGARFHGPQGVALVGDTLYVADTDNHALRAVDLAAGQVTTVAGTGEQALGPPEAGPARTTALNSPWDLVYADGRLYVAMAGSHQLWVCDLDRQEVRLFAGTGREGLRDGPRLDAWLAQPSGIALAGDLLYFADSETSSIRSVERGPQGAVRTLVGQGLFEFGDVDGVGDAVRLQHPIGVAYDGEALLVADTYNHKLKRLGPRTRACTTWAGTGEPGHRDGPLASAQFYEPSGVSVAGELVYVADTNNHAVRVIDPATGTVRTLELRA